MHIDTKRVDQVGREGRRVIDMRMKAQGGPGGVAEGSPGGGGGGTPPDGGAGGGYMFAVAMAFWNGSSYQDCRPATNAGSVWSLYSVDNVAGVHTHYMRQECVPMYSVAGYCPHSGTTSFIDGNGDPQEITASSGTLGTYTGTIKGINPSTGEEVDLTVASGSVTHYDGVLNGEGLISFIDPSTGDTVNGRVASNLLNT